MSSIEIVKKWEKFCEAGKFTEAAKLLTKEVELSTPKTGGIIYGREKLQSHPERIFLPDIEWGQLEPRSGSFQVTGKGHRKEGIIGMRDQPYERVFEVKEGHITKVLAQKVRTGFPIHGNK